MATLLSAEDAANLIAAAFERHRTDITEVVARTLNQIQRDFPALNGYSQNPVPGQDRTWQDFRQPPAQGWLPAPQKGTYLQTRQQQYPAQNAPRAYHGVDGLEHDNLEESPAEEPWVTHNATLWQGFPEETQDTTEDLNLLLCGEIPSGFGLPDLLDSYPADEAVNFGVILGKLWECRVCYKTFSSNNKLYRHIRSEHRFRLSERIFPVNPSEHVLFSGLSEHLPSSGSSGHFFPSGSLEHLLFSGAPKHVLSSGSSEHLLSSGSSEHVLSADSSGHAYMGNEANRTLDRIPTAASPVTPIGHTTKS
ncbi:hypothetical protein GQX73_g2214 [Xylaria multiplex]|uniref:C2H2-type domain-containing protein n=1 Tax=Xylaria multiplex TaxID=323545 RepID=A0A7C8IUJ7_9PEZI|nr:hypothetical protein GQX73_g2214 [Xylaria multiplex]